MLITEELTDIFFKYTILTLKKYFPEPHYKIQYREDKHRKTDEGMLFLWIIDSTGNGRSLGFSFRGYGRGDALKFSMELGLIDEDYSIYSDFKSPYNSTFTPKEVFEDIVSGVDFWKFILGHIPNRTVPEIIKSYKKHY